MCEFFFLFFFNFFSPEIVNARPVGILLECILVTRAITSLWCLLLRGCHPSTTSHITGSNYNDDGDAMRAVGAVVILPYLD